jgi:hypothetical protein
MMKLPPRNTLTGTHAEYLLRRDFYRVYLQARYSAGEDRELPDAASVFTPEGLHLLREHITEEALKAPVVLTERLSNRVLAVHLVQNAVERFVVLNMRFKVDPDVLVHALVEEYVHSQQVLDKIDFEQQREQFAYAERPYELEAKRIATAILGYDPDTYETYLMREEHSDVHYDII